MIELDKKKLVTKLLDERFSNSSDISSLFQLFNPNRSEALERFKRWKKRTYDIISQYINQSEASSFWNLPTNNIYGFPINQHLCTLAVNQIFGHREFVKSLVHNILDNYTYISNESIVKWTYFVLMRLVECKNDGNHYIVINRLSDRLSIPVYELRLYLEQLLPLKMVGAIGVIDDFGSVYITEKGAKEYYRYIEQLRLEKEKANAESEKMTEKTYAENELLVLNTVYTMGKDLPMRVVIVSDLAKALRMSYSDLNEYLAELENRKEFIETVTDESVRITPKGKEFLQGKSNMPNNHSTRNVYNTNINAPSNNQIGGQGNVQNAQLNLNPDFDNAIKSLVELVNNSYLGELEKEERLAEIYRIQQLAQREQTPELQAHGLSKIKLLETGLKVGEMALKASPLIGILVKAFGG